MGDQNAGAQQGDPGAGDAAPEALTEARVAEIVQSVVGKVVNAAVTNHLKRQKTESEQQAGNIEKLVAEAVSKALAASRTAQGTPAEGDAPKPNKELIDLQEKLEKLERKNAESEARAKAIEDKARWDSARGSIRKALESKGVTGIRADAVIALMEQSKALRFDEEGNPRLTVTRSRSKSAPPEEIEWSLAEGVDDWSKSPDAAEFLPPPAPPVNRQGAYGPSQNGARRGPVYYEKPAASIEDAARRAEQMLANQGVDINEAFRR